MRNHQRVVLGAGVVAVTAGLIIAMLGVGTERLETKMRSVVNNATLREAHNSPSVAVHPSGAPVVVANRMDAPEFGCRLWTLDGGAATWAPLSLTPELSASNCFWPRVAFDGDGNLLVLYTPLGGPNILPVGLWLQRFDGLVPAGPPTEVAGRLAFHARMAVVGDTIWASWVQAGPATWENQLGFEPGDNHVVVARSDDAGRSFGPPVRVSEPDRRVIQPTLLAWGDGTVFVGALDLGDDVLNYHARHDGQTPPDPALRWRIVAWRSDDGGRTFSDTIVVAPDLPVPQLIIADLGPTPGFARDPSAGRLYATWDAGRGNARDVFLASSDDGGRTWAAPHTVGPTGGSQHLPAVAVAPDGRVDLLYYDRGRDPDDHHAEAVLATSWDGGSTMTTTSLSERLFDTRVGLGMQQGVPVLGDQLALTSLPDRALAVWTDAGRGTALVENVQDLVAATVEIDPGGGREPVPTAVGVALVAAGSGAALAAVVAARRSRERPRAGGPRR